MKKLLTLLTTAAAVFTLAPTTAEAGHRSNSCDRGHSRVSHARSHHHSHSRGSSRGYAYSVPRFSPPQVLIRPTYCAPAYPPAYGYGYGPGYGYAPRPSFNLSLGFGHGCRR